MTTTLTATYLTGSLRELWEEAYPMAIREALTGNAAAGEGQEVYVSGVRAEMTHYEEGIGLLDKAIQRLRGRLSDITKPPGPVNPQNTKHGESEARQSDLALRLQGYNLSLFQLVAELDDVTDRLDI